MKKLYQYLKEANELTQSETLPQSLSELTKFLYNLKEKFKCQNFEELTILILENINYSEQKKFKLISAILQKQLININHKDEKGVSLLTIACGTENLPIIELFLKNGADPNLKNQNGETPFLIISRHNNLKKRFQILDLLLQYNADINAKDELNGNTALLNACYEHDYKAIDYLISKNADVNITNNNQDTALILLLSNLQFSETKKKYVELLLSKNIDINKKNKNNTTALELVCKGKNLELLELLLKNGADPNTLIYQLKNFWYPILNWVIKEIENQELSKKMTELLLQYGANPNLKDNSFLNTTPLIIACQKNRNDIAKLLLENGANPNLFSSFESPLLVACKNNNIELVKLLLNYGANPKLKMGMIPSALELDNSKEIENILKSNN